MKFTLEITMGNDAVQTGGDVEEIIRTQLEEIGYYAEPPVVSRLIRDLNGATVGSWEFTESEPAGTRACPYCEQPLPDSDDAVNEHYDAEHHEE